VKLTGFVDTGTFVFKEPTMAKTTLHTGIPSAASGIGRVALGVCNVLRLWYTGIARFAWGLPLSR